MSIISAQPFHKVILTHHTSQDHQRRLCFGTFLALLWLGWINHAINRLSPSPQNTPKLIPFDEGIMELCWPTPTLLKDSLSLLTKFKLHCFKRIANYKGTVECLARPSRRIYLCMSFNFVLFVLLFTIILSFSLHKYCNLIFLFSCTLSLFKCWHDSNMLMRKCAIEHKHLTWIRGRGA